MNQVSRTYDLRAISQPEFLKTLLDADREIGSSDRTIESHGHEMTVTWRVPAVDTAALDKTLTSAVKQINQANRMTNVTGASPLGTSFREGLAKLRDQLTKTHQDMQSALADLDDTTQQAAATVKQVRAETADLKAALGLSSNGGPA